MTIFSMLLPRINRKWPRCKGEAVMGAGDGLFLPRVSERRFFILSGNRDDEFYPWLLSLTIAGSGSGNRGFATEPLRVNSPSPAPIRLSIQYF
jgi:hypothetical protein